MNWSNLDYFTLALIIAIPILLVIDLKLIARLYRRGQ